MKIRYDGADDVTFTGRFLFFALLSLLLLGVITFGGWQLGWFFKSQNVNRSAAVNRQSLAFQQARVDELTRKRQDLKSLRATAATTKDADQQAQFDAQSQAIQGIICADYAQLTPSYRATLDPATTQDLATLCGG